ncbi:MAG: hypothetical protein IPM13_15335 [Phycisphaerales bacterium]|nr:hypothetical protein [Phycisphaerales bacterium]
MRPLGTLLAGAVSLALLASCISVDIPGQGTLFVRGEPFIVQGVAAVQNRGGPCRVWIGDNGLTYELYQGLRLTNEEFDRIVQPGARSRLELATRSDLTTACGLGTVVEVQRVLEIID